MKHKIAIEVGGISSNSPADGGTFLQGVGALYATVEVRKESMNNSVSLCVDKPMAWLPFSRSTARKIAEEILEMLGPDDAA